MNTWKSNVYIDKQGDMADNELYEKLCNGTISKKHLDGWSWFTVANYNIVVFVKVDKVQFYDKFTIDHSMLHVETEALMNTFNNDYVLKKPGIAWHRLDDRSNTMRRLGSLPGDMRVDAFRTSTGSGKHIGVLGINETSMTVIGSPAIWLLAEAIRETQNKLGLTNATVTIQPEEPIKISFEQLENGCMYCVRIVAGNQTSEYWKNAHLEGVLVLTAYNNCIVS